ncbi:MAG: N-formylglutamate amidohydrolase [Pseudomonadota bacterium]|nr:N-formylglutamate amidohydrolase [Pseudomonadota bacterium]
MAPLSPPLIHRPRGDLPVILSVPHSGRDYSPELIASAHGGRPALASLEDPLVDRLAWRALGRGLGAVVARAPRAAIDCNRGEDEIDPAVIGDAPRGRLSARARGGLGIVPARTARHGYLWKHPLTVAALEQRIDQAHRPFHRGLEELLALTVDRFGCALLLDCHSMPSPAPGIPPVIIGDAFGRSAGRWLSDAALAAARANGFGARLNDPFAGGHVIERHGRPRAGVHALQLEIDRACYLDAERAAPGPGFDDVARLIDALVLMLGELLLERRFAVAAE